MNWLKKDEYGDYVLKQFWDFSHKFLHNNGVQNLSLVIIHVQDYFCLQKQFVGTIFLTQVSKETCINTTIISIGLKGDVGDKVFVNTKRIYIFVFSWFQIPFADMHTNCLKQLLVWHEVSHRS